MAFRVQQEISSKEPYSKVFYTKTLPFGTMIIKRPYEAARAARSFWPFQDEGSFNTTSPLLLSISSLAVPLIYLRVLSIAQNMHRAAQSRLKPQRNRDAIRGSSNEFIHRLFQQEPVPFACLCWNFMICVSKETNTYQDVLLQA